MCFGMFMAILDIQIVSASLNEIQAGLSASADEIPWVQTAYLIAEVIAVLQRFHPTKIAVESDVTSDAVPKRYQDYLAGKHELTRNEIEQLGFRLAKTLGHATIYAVDADGEFPWAQLTDYAKAHIYKGASTSGG